MAYRAIRPLTFLDRPQPRVILLLKRYCHSRAYGHHIGALFDFFDHSKYFTLKVFFNQYREEYIEALMLSYLCSA